MANCTGGYFDIPDEHHLYEHIETFNRWYEPVHGYVTAILCPVGALMNVLNIIVLAQPDMRTSINIILCAIAVADTVVMTSNLVFVFHFLFIAAQEECRPSHFSWGWAQFALGHTYLSVIGHSTSLWLSVAMAQARYITVYRAQQGQSVMISAKTAILLSWAVLGAVVIAGLPLFFSYRINEFTLSQCYNTSLADVPTYLPGPVTHCTVVQVAFWASGALFKLLPCILLTVLIVLLIIILRQVQRNRAARFVQAQTKGRRNAQDSDRTTRMLIALLGIFLVTEIPQGALALLSGIFGANFRLKIYNHLGNFMDLLSLINSSSNFVILCTMSRKFREVFYRLFLPKSIYTRLANAPVTAVVEAQSVYPPIQRTSIPRVSATGEQEQALIASSIELNQIKPHRIND